MIRGMPRRVHRLQRDSLAGTVIQAATITTLATSKTQRPAIAHTTVGGEPLRLPEANDLRPGLLGQRGGARSMVGVGVGDQDPPDRPQGRRRRHDGAPMRGVVGTRIDHRQVRASGSGAQ